MVFSDRSREHHADDIRGKNSLAPGPHSQSAHAEQQKKKVLGLQFGDAAAIVLEKAGSQERKDEEHDHTHDNEDHGPNRERREDEAQGDNGPQIIYEARCQNRLPEFCLVEAQF